MNELLARLQNNLEWFKLCFNRDIDELSPQEQIIFTELVVAENSPNLVNFKNEYIFVLGSLT